MAYISACGNNKPEECVMIGDDLILDIQGAQNAGLHTILVNSRKLNTPKGTIEVKCVEDITLELINDLCWKTINDGLLWKIFLKIAETINDDLFGECVPQNTFCFDG